jgi:DUF1365 family protein
VESSVYEGTVRHRRFSPVGHAFQYRVYFMYLDLAELPFVFEPYRLWSIGKANIACFLRMDHLGNQDIPLERAVRALVASRTGRRPEGAIRLLTHLRYFGYCFNPVSFYYCYDATNCHIETIVLEVRNTPWLETHVYVLDHRLNEHSMENWRRYRFDKRFHVSPFMDMGMHYDWRFRVPGERINVHMRSLQNGSRLFDASLALRRKEINAANLTRVLTHYPPMTMKVTAMIYWNAMKLHLKGAPFFTHPSKRQPTAKEV